MCYSRRIKAQGKGFKGKRKPRTKAGSTTFARACSAALLQLPCSERESEEERESARYDRYPSLWPETTFRCLRHHPLARRHATSSPNARKQRLTEVELEQEESEAET